MPGPEASKQKMLLLVLKQGPAFARACWKREVLKEWKYPMKNVSCLSIYPLHIKRGQHKSFLKLMHEDGYQQGGLIQGK